LRLAGSGSARSTAASVAVNNGAVNVHTSGGDPIAATEITAVFDRAVEAEVQKDFDTRPNEHGDDALAHPLSRTARQRAFDALHQIFIDSVMTPADGLRPEPLINFVIDPATGIDVLVRHGFLDVDVEIGANTSAEQVDPATRLCATTTRTPIRPDVALRAMVRRPRRNEPGQRSPPVRSSRSVETPKSPPGPTRSARSHPSRSD
jgi:hypothetical protein